ncbi:hypothetical protein [Streptomyces sp. S1D4-20]|uniref:hypothetical protein n=1 Tax=Streptomyces sp. S1D4-20 TaxID=2594462 RepID=UPI0011644E32|nr:hypothetical protein [Streptomyces sp. S1D4-20]QDN54085.1 hypothetical protein FNV67_00450 [Streptomyces sp. S1D4-20]
MHTDKTTLSGQAAAPAVPKPGTEFAFQVSNIGYAAAGLLGEEWSGEDWSAEAHDFGQGSTIKGPYTTGFELHTDHDRDLVIGFTRFEGDGFPGRDERELPPGNRPL